MKRFFVAMVLYSFLVGCTKEEAMLPVAQLEGPALVKVGEPVVYDGSGSYDPDWGIADWLFEIISKEVMEEYGIFPQQDPIQDEETLKLLRKEKGFFSVAGYKEISYTFDTAGEYMVRLTVMDMSELKDSQAIMVQAEE